MQLACIIKKSDLHCTVKMKVLYLIKMGQQIQFNKLELSNN